MESLRLYNNLTLISIASLSGKSEELISHAQNAGALYGTNIRSRGMIRQGKKRRFLKPLTISPSMESILLLTPKENIEMVLSECAYEAGLTRGGIGAVMEVPVQRVWASNTEKNLNTTNIAPENVHSHSISLKKNLRLITCVCQQGKADTIAAAAMKEGSASPIIHYGEGRGVRDRMGILKIAVNPQKEIIYVLTDAFECERILDTMVEAGKLYAPGMGFIFTTDIPIGVINLLSSISGSHTEATTEQIIKAIDELKGSRAWRLAEALGDSTVRRVRKSMTDLINLKLVTRRGIGDDFIFKAMQRGSPGATKSFANFIGGGEMKSSSGRVIVDEREVIDFHVNPDMVESLVQIFAEIMAQYESQNSFVMEIPVPKAITYFG